MLSDHGVAVPAVVACMRSSCFRLTPKYLCLVGQDDDWDALGGASDGAPVPVVCAHVLLMPSFGDASAIPPFFGRIRC